MAGGRLLGRKASAELENVVVSLGKKSLSRLPYFGYDWIVPCLRRGVVIHLRHDLSFPEGKV
jgi:hypothetical protein